MSDSDFKPVNTDEKFLMKEIDILNKNKTFFMKNTRYIKTMLDIIDGKSSISIRVLDWFVANYSKKNNTYYKVSMNGKESLFYVYPEYKNQLMGYSKSYFDPFCRKKKIAYHYNYDNFEINFITSIGQLNFFQWAISRKIIKYVEKNLETIEQDMKVTNKLNRQRKQELSEESSDSGEESEDHSVPDPTICSSDKINSIIISPKKSDNKSDGKKKKKRQQLSKSAYTSGIKKSNAYIKLDFD